MVPPAFRGALAVVPLAWEEALTAVPLARDRVMSRKRGVRKKRPRSLLSCIRGVVTVVPLLPLHLLRRLTSIEVGACPISWKPQRSLA